MSLQVSILNTSSILSCYVSVGISTCFPAWDVFHRTIDGSIVIQRKPVHEVLEEQLKARFVDCGCVLLSHPLQLICAKFLHLQIHEKNVLIINKKNTSCIRISI